LLECTSEENEEVYREVSQFGLHFAITMAIAVKCQKRDFFGL